MRERKPPPGRAGAVLLVLFALAPFALWVGWLMRFHVPAPLGDTWELVPLLQKVHEGAFGFADLWTARDGHRPVFPTLILLALAKVTRWQGGYETGLNAALAAVFFFTLILHWRAAARRYAVPWLWLVPLFAALIFSLSQWQNWFVGWQVQVFLCAFATWCTFCLLTLPRSGVPDFLLALALAIVATFSCGSGMMVWAVGACLCWLGKEHARSLYTGVWAAAGIAVFAVHFIGLTPESQSAPGSLLHLVVDTLIYMGAPIAYGLAGEREMLDGLPAMVAGGIGLITWGAANYALVRRRHEQPAWWLPYLGLGLFAVCSALLAAFAPADAPTGMPQGLSSRDITLANLFWVALFAQAWLAWGRGRNARTRWAVVLVFLVVLGAATMRGACLWQLRYPVYRDAGIAIMRGEEAGAELPLLYPDRGTLRDRAAWLRRQRMGIYR
ncbi:MAG: hypothetical protein ACLFTT_03785 [Candidatus Hydrogenedentota bacterium]